MSTTIEGASVDPRGRSSSSIGGGENDHEEDEDKRRCVFLRKNQEQKLIQVACNYFSLGHCELARATTIQLYRESPSDALQLLNALIFSDPPQNWIFSPTMPSSAHLRWFCMNLRDELVESHSKTTGKDEEEKTDRQGDLMPIPAWLLDGTQFDILLVCSLLRGDKDAVQSFTRDVISELRTCMYSCLLRRRLLLLSSHPARSRKTAVTPRIPPLAFIPVMGFVDVGSTHLSGRTTLVGFDGRVRKLGSAAIVQVRNTLHRQDAIGEAIFLQLSAALVSAGETGEFKGLQRLASQLVAKCLIHDRHVDACRLVRCLQRQQRSATAVQLTMGTNLDPTTTTSEPPPLIDPLLVELLSVLVELLEMSGREDAERNRRKRDGGVEVSETPLTRKLSNIVSRGEMIPKIVTMTRDDGQIIPPQLFRGRMYEALLCQEGSSTFSSCTSTSAEREAMRKHLALLESFFLQEEIRSRSQMIASPRRPVPDIFVRYDPSKVGSWFEFWDEFASFVWADRRKRCHFVEWVLRRARECVVKYRDFQSAALLLEPFRPLRGLLLLLSADSFDGDIVSLQRLVDAIWDDSSRDWEADDDTVSSSGRKGHFASSEPRVEKCCDELAYRIRFAWWYACRYSGSRLLKRREASTTSSSSSLTKDEEEEVANAVLRDLASHSMLWVTRECMSRLDESDFLKTLVSRPPGTRESVAEHRRDLIVLRGYYAFRHAFKICFDESRRQRADRDSMGRGPRDKAVVEALEPVRDHLLRVPPMWRVRLMEGLFCLLFLRRSHLKRRFDAVDGDDNAGDAVLAETHRKVGKVDSGDGTSEYIGTIALIQGMLGVLSDCLKAGMESTLSPSVDHRMRRLQQYVKEATERVETIVATEKHWRRSPSQMMGRMLSSPLSLLRVCLKQGQYERGERLIQFFDLPSSCARDVTIARTLDNLAMSISTGRISTASVEGDLEILKTLKKVVLSADSDVSARLETFCMAADLAICASGNIRDSKAILDAASSEIMASVSREFNATAIDESKNFSTIALFFVDVLKYVNVFVEANKKSNIAPPLRQLVAHIEKLPSEPDMLESHLERRQKQGKALAQLRRVLSKSEKSNRAQLDRLLVSVINTLGSTNKRQQTRRKSKRFTQSVDKTKEYLLQFLHHLVEVGSQLRSAGLDSSDISVLQREPRHVLAEVVFEYRGWSEATSLSRLMRIDLVKIILRASRCRNASELLASSRSPVAHGLQASRSLSTNSRSSMSSKSSVDPSAKATCGYGSDGKGYKMSMATVTFLASSDSGGVDEEPRPTTQGPLLAALACLFRETETPFGAPFVWYALQHSRSTFPVLHRWTWIAKAQPLEHFVRIFTPAEEEEEEEEKEEKEEKEHDDDRNEGGRIGLERFRSFCMSRLAEVKVDALSPGAVEAFNVLNSTEDAQMLDEFYTRACATLENSYRVESAVALSDAMLPPVTKGSESLLLRCAKYRAVEASSSINDGIAAIFNRMRGVVKPAELALKLFHKWSVDVALAVLRVRLDHIRASRGSISFVDGGGGGAHTHERAGIEDGGASRHLLKTRVEACIRDLEIFSDVLSAGRSNLEHKKVSNEDGSDGRLSFADERKSLSGPWQRVAAVCRSTPVDVARQLAMWGEHELARRVCDQFVPPETRTRRTLCQELVEAWVFDLLTASPPSHAVEDDTRGTKSAPDASKKRENAATNTARAFHMLESLGAASLAVCDNILRRLGKRMLHTQLLLVRFLRSSSARFIPKDRTKRFEVLEQSLRILTQLTDKLAKRMGHLLGRPALLVESLLMTNHVKTVDALFRDSRFESLRSNEIAVRLAGKALLVNFEEISSKRRRSSLTRTKHIESLRDNDHNEIRLNDFVLTAQVEKDNTIRRQHKYANAPSIDMARSLLRLCPSPLSAAEAAVNFCDRLCLSQSTDILDTARRPSKPSLTPLVRELIVHLLRFARRCFGEVERDSSGATPPALTSPHDVKEKYRELVEKNTKAAAGVRTCAKLLKCIPLLETLHRLSARGSSYASLALKLTDMTSRRRIRRVRDILTSPEVDCMRLALRLCSTCDVEIYPVYASWALASIRSGRFEEARLRARKAFEETSSAKETDELVRKIVDELERRVTRPVQSDLTRLLRNLQEVSSALLRKNLWPRSDGPVPYVEGPRLDSPTTMDATLALTARRECLWYIHCFGTKRHLLEFVTRRRPLELSFGEMAKTPSNASLSTKQVSCGLEAVCQLVYRQPKKFPPTLVADVVLEFCLARRQVDDLIGILQQIGDVDFSVLRPFVESMCAFLTCRGFDLWRYSFEVLLRRHAPAAKTCLRLFETASDSFDRLRLLRRAKSHIRKAIIDAHSRGAESREGVPTVDVDVTPGSAHVIESLEELAVGVKLQIRLTSTIPAVPLSVIARSSESTVALRTRRCVVVAEILRRLSSGEDDIRSVGTTRSSGKLVKRSSEGARHRRSSDDADFPSLSGERPARTDVVRSTEDESTRSVRDYAGLAEALIGGFCLSRERCYCMAQELGVFDTAPRRAG
eukprot:g105.t1